MLVESTMRVEDEEYNTDVASSVEVSKE